MASPVRLMRRSIRKTPTGAAAERDRDRADEGAPHELELGEGRDEEVEHKASGARSATAQAYAAGAVRRPQAAATAAASRADRGPRPCGAP